MKNISKIIPLVGSSVVAGFPSPAEDFVEQGIDFNDVLVRHPASTFVVRVSGESMKDANIHSGDMVVVDKSLESKNGDIIIAVLDGDMTIKRFLKEPNGEVYLVPANSRFKPIKIDGEREFSVWGVVTWVIRKARQSK